MSADRTGSGNPMYGRHHKPDVCERIGNAHRGRKRSAETKKRISESRYKSDKIKRCPVCQFTDNGELVNTFVSIKDAEEQTGYFSSCISACLRGKMQHAYGYIWCYQDRPETFPAQQLGLFS